MKWISRRSFLRMAFPVAGAVVAGSYLSRWSRRSIHEELDRVDYSPVQKIVAENHQTEFTGDQPYRAHRALWNKSDYLLSKGGIPKPTETTSIVIVGGGVAGLTSAYNLRQLRPVLLEQAPQFGGNSKGEMWDDHMYSIGAAYVTTGDETSKSMMFLRELGLLPKLRHHSSSDGMSVIYESQVKNDFWNGVTDPQAALQFRRVYEKMRVLRQGPYPDIPPTEWGMTEEKLKALDRLSFAQWLKNEFSSLHPHIHEFFQDYCWSSLGGSMNELSAAQCLNFLLSDLFGVGAFPGGNSAITENLVNRLSRDLPHTCLRPSHLVVDIRRVSDGVLITYEDSEGILRSIQARACIVCSPKFVAKHLIDGLPDDQRVAMSALRYRAYIVANILLKVNVPSQAYDLYRIEPKAESRTYTDLVFASWAAHDRHSRSVLTLYRPYPVDSGRAALYAETAFADLKKSFESVVPELVKTLDLPENSIQTIRLTRWGHPLPLGEPGLIAKGILQKAASVVSDRIFLAQQDNWASPCFESAFGAASRASDEVRKLLSA